MDMSADSELRTRVVEAASRLYYAHGIHEVGMDAVRAASGVPLKRIYALFSSKADLVQAVLEQRRAQWDRGIADAAPDGDDPTERLLAIFDFLADWFRSEDFRGCIFINSYGESASVSDEVRDVVRAQKADFQAYVERLAADAGASPGLARQLCLLAEGAQTSAAIGEDPSWALDARRAAETLIAVGTRREPALR